MDTSMRAKTEMGLRVPLLFQPISPQRKPQRIPGSPRQDSVGQGMSTTAPLGPVRNQAVCSLSPAQRWAPCQVGREPGGTCPPELLVVIRVCAEAGPERTKRVCAGVILCRGRDGQGTRALPVYTKESNKDGKESSSLPLRFKAGFYQGFCVYQVFLYGRPSQGMWVLS